MMIGFFFHCFSTGRKHRNLPTTHFLVVRIPAYIYCNKAYELVDVPVCNVLENHNNDVEKQSKW